MEFVNSSTPRYECLLFGKKCCVMCDSITYRKIRSNYNNFFSCLYLYFFPIDLDDTLYPLSSGLSEACANNIIGMI